MRQPGRYAQQLLVDLLVGAGFMSADLQQVLRDLALPTVAAALPNAGHNPLADLQQSVQRLSGGGHMTNDLLDALEQRLPGLASGFQDVRVAMDLLPAADALLPDGELQKIKDAFHLAKLHEGVLYARLRSSLPPEVRRRASTVPGDDYDQLDAWIDAANRQLIRVGEDVHLMQLLDAAIGEAKPPHRAPVEALRERIRATVLMGDPREFPVEQHGTLERVVQEFGIAVDAGQFFDRGQTALSRVCLIRVGPQDMGTGFLVGDDLILTNYHVLSRVIERARPPGLVRMVFDYRTRIGQSPGEGPKVGLLTAGTSDVNPTPWLIDSSQPTDGEIGGAAAPISETTPEGHLDFALVRLATAIGTQNGPDGHPRSHFEMAPDGPPFVFSQGIALVIVGHPSSADGHGQSSPQVFAIEPDSVIAVNPNGTRVQYRTNTLKGSSGSPVLSADWRLVALHHYGKIGQYNQGVPVDKIAARPNVDQVINT